MPHTSANINAPCPSVTPFIPPTLQRAVGGEVDRRIGESMVGFVEASRLAAAQERAVKAEREAARLKAQTEKLQEEAERLQVRLEGCPPCHRRGMLGHFPRSFFRMCAY